MKTKSWSSSDKTKCEIVEASGVDNFHIDLIIWLASRYFWLGSQISHRRITIGTGHTVGKPSFLTGKPWSRIVELRLVTTFVFFALKNAEKYFVRAKSYLKPQDRLCFDVILVSRCRWWKLQLSDI